MDLQAAAIERMARRAAAAGNTAAAANYRAALAALLKARELARKVATCR